MPLSSETTRKTHNHLRVLGDPDALSLNDLNVVETAEDLVLDLELGAHGELGSLLDCEGLVLEGVLAAGSGEVNGDGVAAGRVHGQGQDDADSGVVGVRDVGATTETEGLLVSLQGLIASVLREGMLALSSPVIWRCGVGEAVSKMLGVALRGS